MKISAFILFLFVWVQAWADSPLTSTPFYSAYMDLEIVQIAEKDGINGKGVMEFLAGKGSIEHKIAVVNAMGWRSNGNASEFAAYLVKVRNVSASLFDSLRTASSMEARFEGLDKLGPDDMTVFAYLQAMGDYFNVQPAFYGAYNGFMNNSGSYSHAIVLGLIISQYNMDVDWCQVYEVMANLDADASLTENPIRPEAKTIIFDYINLYQESCSEGEEEAEAVEEYETAVEEIYPLETELYSVHDNKIHIHEGTLEAQKAEGKKSADLYIVEIGEALYVDEIGGTSITVTVGNKGNVASVPCLLVFKSIDPNVPPTNQDKDSQEMYKSLGGYMEYEDQEMPFYILGQKVESLKPGATVTITFEIPNYWIYDPNIESEAIIDYPGLIEEKDEKNNILQIMRWG
jgi:hypothetical protein